MPICRDFEFICQDCGFQFEKVVLDSRDIPECPVCHKNNVVKMMSACSLKTGCKDSQHLTALIN